MSEARGIRGRLLSACVAGVAALLVAAAPASAANRFAEVGGDGAEPCLLADPCSLVNAVNNSASGDDVTVASGTYALGPSGALVIPANTVVHGTTGAAPTIQNNPGVSAGVQLSAGSVLRDVIYRYSGINNPGILLSGGGTLERVNSVITSGAGSTRGACTILQSGTYTINESVCVNDSAASGAAAGVEIFATGGQTQNVSLTNVTAVSNNADAAILARQQTTGIISATAINTIADGATTDVRAGTITAGSGTVTVNLTNSNYSTVSESEGSGLNVTNAGTGPPNNNQTSAPVYANPGAPNYDFRQNRLSLGTIDQGTATASVLDFEGTTRPQGAAYDIGADEIVRSDAPTITTVPANVEGDTTVSGTTTEPDGTFIELFADALSIGTATANGGAWTVTTPPLVAGASLTATAAAPTEATSLTSSSALVAARSAKPVVTGPLTAGATTVSGTSTEPTVGTMIQVFVNGVPAGVPVLVTAGAWSATVPSLAGGQEVTAKATAPGKAESFASDPVTVAALPTPPGGGTGTPQTQVTPITQVAPAPKKCKKGRKLKKGKCVKKKRKKK